MKNDHAKILVFKKYIEESDQLIEELESKNVKEIKENKQLQKKCDEYIDRIKLLNENLEEIEQTNFEFSQKINDIDSEYQKYKSENKKLIEENIALQEQIMTKNSKIKEIEYESDLLNLKLIEIDEKKKESEIILITDENEFNRKNKKSLFDEIILDEVKIEEEKMAEVKTKGNNDLPNLTEGERVFIKNVMFRNKVHIITHFACLIYIVADLFSKFYEK